MTLKHKIQISAALFATWVITIASVMAVLTMPSVRAQPHTNSGGRYWTAGVDGIANTLTKLTLGTDSAAPDASMEAIYITDLIAQSTTGTAGQMLLRYGTSTDMGGAANCASGTTTFFPSASASTVRINYPLFSGLALHIPFKTAIRVPAGKDICAIGVATQLLVLQLIGEVRP